jgi:anthranilate synthase component 1
MSGREFAPVDEVDRDRAIRTLVSCGDTIYVQAGAGLVADSVPEAEYQETVNKARAVLRAVAMARTAERNAL